MDLVGVARDRRVPFEVLGDFNNSRKASGIPYEEEEDWDDYNANGDTRSQSRSGSGSFTHTPQPESQDTTTVQPFSFWERDYEVSAIPYCRSSITMSFGSEEASRQDAIKELLQTEENYIQDMKNVRKVGRVPLSSVLICLNYMHFIVCFSTSWNQSKRRRSLPLKNLIQYLSIGRN